MEPATRLSIPGPEVPKIVVDPTSVQRAELKERLQRIRLAKVVLKNLPLYEAVGALNELAAKHDKFVRKMEPGTLICMGGALPWISTMDGHEEPSRPITTIPGLVPLEIPPDMNPVVSYVTENVSLAEAIEGLARAGRRHVYIGTNAVYLTKKEHPPAFSSRVYLLPPSMIADLARQKLEPRAPQTPKEQSDSIENEERRLREIEKDPDHTQQVSLDERKGTFTLCATEAVHQTMAEQVEKGWREYYASDEWKKKQK